MNATVTFSDKEKSKICFCSCAWLGESGQRTGNPCFMATIGSRLSVAKEAC